MEARVAETYVAAGFTAHPIRIAGAFSLDSRDEFAQEGLQMKRASMMFADLINGKKGGLSVGNSRSVHFMFVGDGSSEEGTQLATERAIREDADFIMPPYSSHLTRAASQVTQAASMILLAAGASSTSAFNSSNLTFGVYPPASQSLSSELDLLGLRLSNTNTTCGFIQSDSIWGRAACAPGPARARRNGLVVPNESISTIQFAASVKEVRTVLSTMQAADIDMIIGCTYDHESEALVRALQEPSSITHRKLWPSLFSAVWDRRSTSTWCAHHHGTLRRLSSARSPTCRHSSLRQPCHRSRFYGDEPSHEAAAMFTSLCALAVAIEKAETLNTSAVATQLRSLVLPEFFDNISFDANGMVASLTQVTFNMPAGPSEPVRAASINASTLIYPMPPWPQRWCEYIGPETTYANYTGMPASGPQCSGHGTCNKDGTCDCEVPAFTDRAARTWTGRC
jgi:hypothetical protein